MPIYAYRCAACGVEKDVLQKFSDAPLTVCPACSADAFGRVLTAPAFQLKGSGWYVTDFRDGNKPKAAGESGSGGAAATAGSSEAGAAKSSEAKTGDAGSAGGATKASDSSTASAGTAASGTA